MKSGKVVKIGGFKVKLRLDGPLLRLSVRSTKGKAAEWLCEEVNEGRGLAFTFDEDLLALDGMFDEPRRDAAFARAAKDPVFRKAAGLSHRDIRLWRAEMRRQKEAPHGERSKPRFDSAERQSNLTQTPLSETPIRGHVEVQAKG